MGTKQYDVVIVGSGAAGSFAAKELTQRGMEVLILEAGRAISEKDFPLDLKGPREKGIQLWARARAAVTGQPIQSKVALYARQLKHLFVRDSEHPYSTPKDTPFLWIRGKQLGGRLHTFGRVLMRWSDYDFKSASRDGYGEDWPISYADLAPYYDRVEEFLGVYGCEDNIRNLPDGKFVGPSKLTSAERDFKEKTETRWPDRRVVAWRYMPPNSRRIPQGLLAAKETGRLTIRTDAVATRVLTDSATGRATGVEFVDRVTKESESVSGKVVLLCASTIETVRLMLNSRSSRHPDGLANSSGTLGRYFMDQVPSLIMGAVPGRTGSELDDTVAPDPFYGVTGGVYIPRWANLDGTTNPDFMRGFAYQGTIGRLFVPEGRPARFGIMGFGEMLPNAKNTITLNPGKRDAWGVPIPHITCAMSGNELAMLREQTTAIIEMVRNAGLEVEFCGSALGLTEFGRGAFPEADWFSRWLFRRYFTQSMSMGAAIHETGGARMGTDPARSVLNAHNQAWDVPNLFVTDGSSFPTGGCSGATLTIMALTARACEYIATGHAAGRL
ncbi:GMC family oxidoreductase [Burkholderia multivorans]|uniref:GMC oxidoreductase n=1 Tax=Burkholderia multivorans TaxID=87883 RepID=UPI001C211617|nr:GMC family oxidoreductase [Burkholderia multivorans]MBU9205432.1 GMC family oxidoreductase [Burkholderia multivorans]MCO8353441.1 GMC family oxidoreductase [Burkholderia multivorans]MCO8385700.1 GMC family oxidoreductase [Burkholderia multivorans]MCO8406619.1 GMC family oxidoreductase [Burkholderia multivorans]MCO8434796.1 GMC family oxidoreductase [Burkholderia multivorans]